MILYHGSNGDIDVIDINRGSKYKDFGRGFYLTPEKSTAIRMAEKKAKLFGGTATLLTYELDDDVMQSGLNIKVFPKKATKEWFLFVDANRDRNNTGMVHDYDIVIGPIADDGVVLQLTNYREGVYSLEQAAQLLQDKFLDQQYFFSSVRSLKYLHKMNVQVV